MVVFSLISSRRERKRKTHFWSENPILDKNTFSVLKPQFWTKAGSRYFTSLVGKITSLTFFNAFKIK
jgi:hypothetical protein